MAPLKSLEQEFPMIDSDFQLFCSSIGILTVEDLLIQDIDDLISSAKCQPFPERLKQGITQVLSCINDIHRPWINGMELFEDARQDKLSLASGCEELDLLLEGGFRKGQLTELVGPSSSGKTQVCMQTTSTVAKRFEGGVVVLDTSNSFSAKRVARFFNHASGPNLTEIFCGMVQARYKVPSDAMKGILCYPVFDIFSMLDVLHQLDVSLKDRGRNEDVHLIIIDSLSSLFSTVVGGSGPHGHALMSSVGFLLKRLAHEYNICIIVTNHMVAGERGIPKPALGESWKSVPHVRILLSRSAESNICIASVIKHTLAVHGRSVAVRVGA